MNYAIHPNLDFVIRVKLQVTNIKQNNGRFNSLLDASYKFLI